jgi:hypothetical protein
MLFAQPIKARLDSINVARAISCKDILEWGCVYPLSANATADRLYGITFYVVHQPGPASNRISEWVGLKKIPIYLHQFIPLMLDPLAMDEKVMDIFLLRNIPLLLFLKSFKKAE